MQIGCDPDHIDVKRSDGKRRWELHTLVSKQHLKDVTTAIMQTLESWGDTTPLVLSYHRGASQTIIDNLRLSLGEGGKPCSDEELLTYMWGLGYSERELEQLFGFKKTA
jgi:hypothetical protein